MSQSSRAVAHATVFLLFLLHRLISSSSTPTSAKSRVLDNSTPFPNLFEDYSGGAMRSVNVSGGCELEICSLPYQLGTCDILYEGLAQGHAFRATDIRSARCVCKKKSTDLDALFTDKTACAAGNKRGGKFKEFSWERQRGSISPKYVQVESLVIRERCKLVTYEGRDFQGRSDTYHHYVIIRQAPRRPFSSYKCEYENDDPIVSTDSTISTDSPKVLVDHILEQLPAWKFADSFGFRKELNTLRDRILSFFKSRR